MICTCTRYGGCSAKTGRLFTVQILYTDCAVQVADRADSHMAVLVNS